ncbi:MAG: hypothetical protein CMM89_04555 [Rickettsiales bacterium]|nr:hypothetical protein [Rickettsiales bacterium]OUT44198.1 MAG: hypothetical protein CBB73_04450 [Pelagibacteraceae bacterium TMED13]|tara:strand:+ start:375 stop:1331 length:957 start_codon:yes stop_codon:yes gene_type:complete
MKNEIIKKIESILEKKKISYENLKFLAGDASNRKYFNIKIKNKDFVLMYDDNPESLKKFIQISKVLLDIVTIPKIFLNFKVNDILIIENFGHKKFSNIINCSNQNFLYSLATDALIHVHKQEIEHNLNFYDENKFTSESNLFFEWFLQKNESLKDKSKIDFNNEFKAFIDLLENIPKVFIHRDYHADNLFFIENRKKHFKCGWIDYQDALVGPCAYDLVSLTQDARIDVDTQIERKIINYYLKSFSNINPTEFEICYKIIAIQRHLKVLGIFKRLAARDNKKNYLVHIPRVIRMLKKNLNNKEFRPISKILIPLLNHD